MSDVLDWRWVFLVNVPLGVAALAVVAAVLPSGFGQREDRRVPVDIAGIAVLTVAVGALLVGLHRHAVVPSWFDQQTGGLIAVGLAGLVLLVIVERRAAAPILPPRLLTHPVTGRLLVAGASATFGLYALVVLLPRLLQLDQGTSATATGVRMYPFLLGLLVAVSVGVSLIQRHGRYVPVLVGANTVVVVAAAGFGAWGGDTTYAGVAVLVLLGLGMGPALSGLQMVIGRVTAPADLGAAMGALLLGRQVGGVLALTVSEALYTSRIAHGAAPNQATGTSVAAVAACGAVVAAVALLGLRGRDTVAQRVAGVGRGDGERGSRPGGISQNEALAQQHAARASFKT